MVWPASGSLSRLLPFAVPIRLPVELANDPVRDSVRLWLGEEPLDRMTVLLTLSDAIRRAWAAHHASASRTDQLREVGHCCNISARSRAV